MTCKDCLHYEICEAYSPRDSYATLHCAEECVCFTDRSEWVHLPCKRVYFICDKNTKFAMVMSKSIKDLCIYEIKEIDKSGHYFSTKEKAEKALEGMK